MQIGHVLPHERELFRARAVTGVIYCRIRSELPCGAGECFVLLHFGKMKSADEDVIFFKKTKLPFGG